MGGGERKAACAPRVNIQQEADWTPMEAVLIALDLGEQEGDGFNDMI